MMSLSIDRFQLWMFASGWFCEKCVTCALPGLIPVTLLRSMTLREFTPICTLGAVGAAHVFHTHNIDGPVPPPDDLDTSYIGWPNFHSGANGDFQSVEAAQPMHPVMREVMYLPAHPHEGAVVAPASEPLARVIATGKSQSSGQRFNIAVAFERSANEGPAIAESTFHHFADYNWDPRRGSPDFVTEAPGDTLPNTPRAMASVHRYVRNVALWLAGAL